MSESNVAVLKSIRQELDELFAPLGRWRWAAPAEREDADREQIVTLPVDLAWYGWSVTMERIHDGWQVTICQSIQGNKVKIVAEDRTYLDCLGELARQATQSLDRIEAAQARKQAKSA